MSNKNIAACWPGKMSFAACECAGETAVQVLPSVITMMAYMLPQIVASYCCCCSLTMSYCCCCLSVLLSLLVAVVGMAVVGICCSVDQSKGK